MDSVEELIIFGIVMGTFARFYLLRVDFRQYPSYPQGYVIHLTIGMIAAALGAVAFPALIKKEYTAVTFLAVALQQFREIRGMERESLNKIEETELIKRGTAYIEDIAKTFEARNYIVLITSLATSIMIYLTHSVAIGILSGIVVVVSLKKIMDKTTIGQVADVKRGDIKFIGALLKIDDIVMMNVGLKEARQKIMEKGVAISIKPKDDNTRITLGNIGQRQAIVHDISVLFGILKETDEPEFSSIAKRDPKTGDVAIFIIPKEPDIDLIIEAVKRLPILESAKRYPLFSETGRKAAD
ncbi:MAG: YIEGIA family protein [Clostridia bacterium]|nr:YIEGIA family protein [Clostridia bacterium]